MITATFKKLPFHFNFKAGTSRGVLTKKNSWFIFLRYKNNPGVYGIGECSIIPGLSIDDRLDYEKQLTKVCESISFGEYDFDNKLNNFPSIRFGLEMAMLDLKNGGSRLHFNSDFTCEKDFIPINGLIWMNEIEKMRKQVKQKIEDGFSCIKIKVGALPFADELKFIKEIRNTYGNNLELRLDANGGYAPGEALEKLKQLSEFNIHSIEQPIKQGNWNAMADLCKTSPVPIVLDEELIGVSDTNNKKELLNHINPQYIILKPSLLGGLKASEEWISLADKKNIKWWITSALESNIGLNAIAQWCYTFKNKIPQGLGTSQIYNNNIKSPLYLSNDKLYYARSGIWNLEPIMDTEQ